MTVVTSVTSQCIFLMYILDSFEIVLDAIMSDYKKIRAIRQVKFVYGQVREVLYLLKYLSKYEGHGCGTHTE